MPKVSNIAGRTVEMLGWKVLSDGRVIDPRGEIQDDLPDRVAFSNQAKHLADLNLITIQGYKVQQNSKPDVDKAVPVADKLPELPKQDDLTELANIGASRVRKLNDKKIFTFQQLVDLMSPAELGELLQIEQAVAASIIEEAASKLGEGSE